MGGVFSHYDQSCREVLPINFYYKSMCFPLSWVCPRGGGISGLYHMASSLTCIGGGCLCFQSCRILLHFLLEGSEFLLLEFSLALDFLLLHCSGFSSLIQTTMVFHFGGNLHFPNGLQYWSFFYVFICSFLDLWWGIPSNPCQMSLGWIFFFIFEWTDCFCFCYTPWELWDSISGFSVPAHESTCLLLGQDHTVFYCCNCFSVVRAYFIGLGQEFPSFSKWCSVIFKYFFFSSTSAQFLLSSPQILVGHEPIVILN